MLITEQKPLKAFCEKLRGETFITIDTEFLREKTYYPKLCLIQISGPDGEAAAIDPLVENLDLQPVYDLLFDAGILKVFHAGRQDLEIFFNLTGKVVTPIFDTQIAAMVCGYGDSVGYESLVKNVTDQQVDKSSQFTDWSRRPLSEKQLSYALGDVTHLIDVYKSIAQQLQKNGRTEWVFEEEEILSNPQTYEVDFETCWKRVKLRSPKPKTLVVLRALAAWREKEAQRRNMPKNWVMRDETLADMAAQAPKDVKALQRIRNMSADVASGPVGETLLKLIKEALASPSETWPKLEKRKPPPASVAPIIDMLRLLLKIRSSTGGVATKLIASSEDLEILATKDTPDIAALKGWRYELFGKDAQALKNGELAITLKDGKIDFFKP